MHIRVGLLGYGNLGRGVEYALSVAPDMTLCAVFTRRDPQTIHTHGAPVCSVQELPDWRDKLDVLLICGGSATDLPIWTPEYAGQFNVVDSFDNHSKIPEHFAAVDAPARSSGHTALICGGWDPGMFSLNRLYAMSILPEGQSCTFWGKGVSQGHSDAIRRIPGVLDARQYTIPVEAAMEKARHGCGEGLTTRQKHIRYCYVVAEPGADQQAIRQAIVTMPNYFADYDTTVEFITAQQMQKEHSGLPHGGVVLRTGVTGWEKEHRQTVEYRLTLDSNPEFTGSVLVACARAVVRMHSRGEYGCKTVFDLRPADISPCDYGELLGIL